MFLDSFKSVLGAFALFSAFAIPVAPLLRTSEADKPANKGTRGRNLPVFGIGIILFFGDNVQLFPIVVNAFRILSVKL